MVTATEVRSIVRPSNWWTHRGFGVGVGTPHDFQVRRYSNVLILSEDTTAVAGYMSKGEPQVILKTEPTVSLSSFTTPKSWTICKNYFGQI
jgi:hypothetical protein